MRAWQITEPFGLDTLKQVDRPDPPLGPGRIRLRMTAASLNFRDLVVVKGQYGRDTPSPLVPVSDGVGEVAEVGPGVTRLKVGDRAATLFFQGWIDGQMPADARHTTLGFPLDGALAEQMVLDQNGAVPIPDSMTDAEAATLPCAALTAWSALVDHGRLMAGDTVLTQGTGGVSLFALQIAKAHGARVVITSSSDEKLARARALGADHGINYRTTPDWAKAAKAWLREQGNTEDGFNHVMELGGTETLDQSIRAVRNGGQISLIGVLSGAVAKVTLPLVLMRGVRVQGVTVGHRNGFAAMVKAFSANGIKPVIDSEFAFDDVPAAFEHLQSGGHFGKIVIRF